MSKKREKRLKARPRRAVRASKETMLAEKTTEMPEDALSRPDKRAHLGPFSPSFLSLSPILSLP